MTDYLRAPLPGQADTDEPASVQGRYVSPDLMWEATRLVAQSNVVALAAAEPEQRAESRIVIGRALGFVLPETANPNLGLWNLRSLEPLRELLESARFILKQKP